MLENMSSNNIFEYKKLSKEEQEKRGILGRLVGVMADSINPTRNGRKYSAELWQKVFENPIMKEKIENRVCFGEACHPTDGREEVDPEKVAICLAEVPKMNNKGQLIGIFDVLDTPCGRILKTMLDYGANIGVSSRGSGDVETDFLGEESVNPDTYDCICWDAVFVPAVKEARLKLVTESLEGKTLRQALAESIEAANEEEKVIMKETLSNLNIRLDEDTSFDYMMLSRLKSDCDYVLTTLKNHRKEYPDQFIDDNRLNDIEHGLWAKDIDKHIDYMLSIYDKLEEKPEWISRDDIENYRLQLHNYVEGIDEDSNNMAVDDTKATLDELQEALKENKELANTITSLQEKLSVSYAKEAELQEEVNKYSKSIRKLSNDARQLDPLKAKISSLNEELNSVNKKLDQQNSLFEKTKKTTERISRAHTQLAEKYDNNEKHTQKLQERLNALKAQSSEKERILTENIADLKNTIEVKNKEYSQKLSKANKLVENYKSIANKAVDKYIDSQARILGVKKEEIKNRLPESYTFDDIDTVCEDLREYKLNINKLPFRTMNLNENIQIKATPSKNETILPANNFGDEVDEQLMNLAGL